MYVIDPEQLTFEYRLRYRGVPGIEHDPSGYPLRWEITARAAVFADGGEEVRAGMAVVYLVPRAGMINLDLILGAVDRELAGVAELLTAVRPELVADYLQDGGDLMIVSALEVAPGFRGHRLGYTVLNAILKTVGRAVDLVVLRAVPVPTDDAAGEGTPDYEAAKAGLRSYWQGFGFEEAGGDYLSFVKESVE